MNCTNINNPDSYGHFREAKITQTKHHWWWKINYIMDNFLPSQNHQGDFVFIEEDHYLSPDFIHLWKLMKEIRKNFTQTGKTVNLLTLGNYEKSKQSKTDFSVVHNTNWFSSHHNMAYTIDRNLWYKIKSCQREFCSYDDYNWDWSLQHVFDQCFKQKLSTLVPRTSRVIHIGSCGLHQREKNCNESQKSKSSIGINLFLNEQNLFPERLILQSKSLKTRRKKLRKNGGWSDPRDHFLCSHYGMFQEKLDVIFANFENLIDDLQLRTN
ncbi:hypothetical protein SSS_10408 [Sarcoptes scabiei]|nr:hypothetical protein SSS_10408 [Sarcoptes scabiei]